MFEIEVSLVITIDHRVIAVFTCNIKCSAVQPHLIETKEHNKRKNSFNVLRAGGVLSLTVFTVCFILYLKHYRFTSIMQSIMRIIGTMGVQYLMKVTLVFNYSI